MENGMITRRQAEIKYNADYSTINMAIQMFDVEIAGKDGRSALYKEEDIVNALANLYTKRAAGFRKAAAMWGNRADNVADIFMKSKIKEKADGTMVQDS